MNIILILVALFFLSISSITDLFTLHVPDLVSWGFVFIVSVIQILIAIYQTEIGIVFSSVQGGLAMFAGGSLLYMIGYWGGADAKLLTGIGVLYGWGIELFVFAFILFVSTVLYLTAWKAIFSAISIMGGKKRTAAPLVPVFLFSYIVVLIFG